jgi:hypothetical protein
MRAQQCLEFLLIKRGLAMMFFLAANVTPHAPHESRRLGILLFAGAVKPGPLVDKHEEVPERASH